MKPHNLSALQEHARRAQHYNKRMQEHAANCVRDGELNEDDISTMRIRLRVLEHTVAQMRALLGPSS